jgi:coenzyme Q-binding protein COQ10
MPRHSEQRDLPYPPLLLFDVVADIERYPEFLPWCVAARIRERNDNLVVADMMIGFRGLKESFTSRVTLNRLELKIDVAYEDGPFKYLNNHWIFEENNDGNCRLDFFVEFEFRSRILATLMDMLFQKAVQRMVAAFESRAAKLYNSDALSTHQTRRISQQGLE